MNDKIYALKEIKTIPGDFDQKKCSPSGGLEPPTFRLTVERASQLRHEGSLMGWPVTKKKEYFRLEFRLRRQLSSPKMN